MCSQRLWRTCQVSVLTVMTGLHSMFPAVWGLMFWSESRGLAKLVGIACSTAAVLLLGVCVCVCVCFNPWFRSKLPLRHLLLPPIRNRRRSRFLRDKRINRQCYCLESKSVMHIAVILSFSPKKKAVDSFGATNIARVRLQYWANFAGIPLH